MNISAPLASHGWICWMGITGTTPHNPGLSAMSWRFSPSFTPLRWLFTTFIHRSPCVAPRLPHLQGARPAARPAARWAALGGAPHPSHSPWQHLSSTALRKTEPHRLSENIPGERTPFPSWNALDLEVEMRCSFIKSPLFTF